MTIERKMQTGWTFKSDTMYNKYNVYRDGDMFGVNPNWQSIAQIEYVGKRNIPIVVIDDFFINVDKVRELALSAHYSNHTNKMNASPGIRCVFDIHWDIGKIAQAYFNNWYLEELNVKCPFNWPNKHNMFTIIDTSEPMVTPQCYPHIDISWQEGQRLGDDDTQHTASIVYLNTDDECKGGTGIYKCKTLDSHLCTSKDKFLEWDAVKKPKRTNNINYEDNDMFELVYEAKMKYNRFIMYPTCLFHHPIYKPDYFTGDNCRITMGSFV